MGRQKILSIMVASISQISFALNFVNAFFVWQCHSQITELCQFLKRFIHNETVILFRILVTRHTHMRVYPKVSGLATWSGKCKWYSSLPLDANLWVSLVSSAVITLCVDPQQLIPKVSVYFFIDSVRKVLDTPSYIWSSLCLILEYFSTSLSQNFRAFL
jgi:hypothetical protein